MTQDTSFHFYCEPYDAGFGGQGSRRRIASARELVASLGIRNTDPLRALPRASGHFSPSSPRLWHRSKAASDSTNSASRPGTLGGSSCPVPDCGPVGPGFDRQAKDFRRLLCLRRGRTHRPDGTSLPGPTAASVGVVPGGWRVDVWRSKTDWTWLRAAKRAEDFVGVGAASTRRPPSGPAAPRFPGSVTLATSGLAPVPPTARETRPFFKRVAPGGRNP